MKKTFSVCLGIFFALALTFVFLPATLETPVSAATSGTTGDCTWTLDGTVLTISGNGATGDYMYSRAPWGNSIKEVVIEDGVTSIGDYVFFDCDGLTSITIPNSVTSIGTYPFYNCSALQAVYITDLEAWCNIEFNIPSSNPLYYAKNLYLNGILVTELTIPDSVTSIGHSAFEGCTSLTSITIPDSVTSIGGNAFEGCTGLTSVTIPNNVTFINLWAFSGCKNLTTVTLPHNFTSINAFAFDGCKNIKDVYYSIPSRESYDIEAVHNDTLINATWHFIAPEKHTFSGATTWTEIKTPTCIEAGIKEGNCSICAVKAQEPVEATGHSYDNGTITKAATETEKGIKTFTCSSCGETYTEDIPVLEATTSKFPINIITIVVAVIVASAAAAFLIYKRKKAGN